MTIYNDISRSNVELLELIRSADLYAYFLYCFSRSELPDQLAQKCRFILTCIIRFKAIGSSYVVKFDQLFTVRVSPSSH